MQIMKIKLGISACLLGRPVRYGGGHKLDTFLRDTVGRFVEYVPVCPEAEAGFGIPREPMQLEGDPEAPRMVTIDTRRDMTEAITSWAEKRLEELAKEELRGFILKSRSPSCAIGTAPLFGETGEAIGTASGVFTLMLIKRLPDLPITDEARLADPDEREKFFGRVFTPETWKTLRKLMEG